MPIEYVLWGRKKGDEEWEEQLITSTQDKDHLANAKRWAKANGFSVLRLSKFAGEKPDFTSAVKQGERK